MIWQQTDIDPSWQHNNWAKECTPTSCLVLYLDWHFDASVLLTYAFFFFSRVKTTLNTFWAWLQVELSFYEIGPKSEITFGKPSSFRWSSFHFWEGEGGGGTTSSFIMNSNGKFPPLRSLMSSTPLLLLLSFFILLLLTTVHDLLQFPFLHNTFDYIFTTAAMYVVSYLFVGQESPKSTSKANISCYESETKM